MSIKAVADGAVSCLMRRYLSPFWIRRRQLARTQWYDAEALNRLQMDLLQRLLKHCYTTVPHYRTLMDGLHLKPEDVKRLDDIRVFPTLTKQQVLAAGDALVSRRYPRWLCRTAYTGGTTGTPLTLRRALFSIGNEHAFVRRQYDWAGIRLTDRCAFLTGRLVARPDQTHSLYAYDPFMNELILSTYHLSPQTAREYAQVMREYRVKAVVGYPSAVHLLARACQDGGPKLSLSAALTSSEVLTDAMRRTIESTFGCRVFDFYGSAERVCYIHTCEAGTYHIVPEYGLTELLPVEGEEPNRCRVVSTGFWNPAMPLVRYDSGDIVIRKDQSCTCGRAFPAIARIVGREGDCVVTPSGRQFGAAILTHLLYGTGNLLESQIVQDTPDHVRIDYVPASNFSEENMSAFRGLIAMHLPAELHVDFRKVEAVERTQSGKIRPVLSQIGVPVDR